LSFLEITMSLLAAFRVYFRKTRVTRAIRKVKISEKKVSKAYS
jgi:hypothetical protein